MKPSSVSYYTFDDKSSCIIASLPHRDDTQVIYIDPIMGTLQFSGIKGYDVFDNKSSAIEFVSKGRQLKECIDACSILGYVFSDKCCHLLLIEKVKPLFPIFDKYMVYGIGNVVIVDIPTEIRCPQSSAVNIELLRKYPFNCAHYYCPSLDLTKDFGSLTRNVRTCWNHNLRLPFERFFSLVPNLCVSIFQGVVTYTSFVEINIGMLLMSSRLFPPFFPRPEDHPSESGITANEYNIDIYLIKSTDSDYEVLNHIIQIGDFPFNWSAEPNSSKCAIDNRQDAKIRTQAYIKRQEVPYVNFFNFMSAKSFEVKLKDTLNLALSDITENSSSIQFEQDDVEWIQSLSNAKELPFDVLIQNYWPRAEAKIKKIGFIKSVVKNVHAEKATEKKYPLADEVPYICDPKSYQKGICRFLYHNSFDRELLGLFFYIMKLLEIMCLGELGLNFPQKLFVLKDLDTFKSGFVYFTAKFLLEFNRYLHSFGRCQIGDMADLICEYIKHTPDLENYQINYPAFQEAANVLKSITVPSIFSVTQGASSFVMSKNVGNQIFSPFNNEMFELTKNDQPLTICLNEPSFVKYIVLHNTNATGISVLGGYRLNRMIKIASKISIPYVPKNEQGAFNSYAFIDLSSNSSVYDTEIHPNEFEQMRFLVIKFKTFKKDRLRICNFYAYGSNIEPNYMIQNLKYPNTILRNMSARTSSPHSEGISNSYNPIPKPSRANSFSVSEISNSAEIQDISKNSSAKRMSRRSKSKSGKGSKNRIGSDDDLRQFSSLHPDPKSRNELIIKNEEDRLLKHEDYFQTQKESIMKGVVPDSLDLELIFSPKKVDQEPRKATCTKCRVKKLCEDCPNCHRPFCQRCMKKILIGQLTFCDECLNKRHKYLTEIEKLKSLQMELLKEKCPFLPVHYAQATETKTKPIPYINFEVPKEISSDDFFCFNDINRPPLAALAYDPPVPSKMVTSLPESVFTSSVNYSFESNLVPLTIILAAEAKITAFNLSCSTKTEVTIENATPSHFTFEPPGGIQKVEFLGRVINLVLSGEKVELNNIRFFGKAAVQNVGNKNACKAPNAMQSNPTELTKIKPVFSQFCKNSAFHELIFDNYYQFVGIKYSATNHLPTDMIIELKNNGEVDYIHCKVARIFHSAAESGQQLGIILFESSIIASKVRIFYPRLNSRLSSVYTTEIPEMFVSQKRNTSPIKNYK